MTDRASVFRALYARTGDKLWRAAYAAWAYVNDAQDQAMQEMGVDQNTYDRMLQAHEMLTNEQSERGDAYRTRWNKVVLTFRLASELDAYIKTERT